MRDAIDEIRAIIPPKNPEMEAGLRSFGSLLGDMRNAERVDPASLESMRTMVGEMVSLALTEDTVDPAVLVAASEILTYLDDWRDELTRTEPVLSQAAGKSLGEIVEMYTGSLATPWGVPARWAPGAELAQTYRNMRGLTGRRP